MRRRDFLGMLGGVAAGLAVGRTAMAAGLGWPLVFERKGTVFLLPAEGGQARRLGKGWEPSLSPGGSRAVWVESSAKASTARLVLCDTAAGTLRELARPSENVLTPRFSPDGARVAYVRRFLGGEELLAVRPGEAPVVLARSGPQGPSFYEPMWSPDGAHVATQDMRELTFWNLDGKAARRLALGTITGAGTDMLSSAHRFALRPGKPGHIAFSMGTEGTALFRKKVPDVSSGLFLYDEGTGTTTALTPKELTAFAPAWTPDGRALVFTGYTDVQAGGEYPFRTWMLEPGGRAVDLGPGAGPMPPSGA